MSSERNVWRGFVWKWSFYDRRAAVHLWPISIPSRAHWYNYS